MRSLYKICSRSLAATFISLFFVSAIDAKVFLQNDGLVNDKAVEKIEQMGKELKDKTGVSTHIVVVKSLNNKFLVNLEKEYAKEFKNPYILLTLANNEHQVDIVSSKDVADKFDKSAILSPYPWSGTIIPILTAKKGNDKVSAAILNGYSDIVDQVSSSFNVTLDSSIGSTNREVIGFLRFIFYGFIVLAIGIVIYYKRKKRSGN